MSDYPEKTQLLPNEQVIHSSGGTINPAILFFEEPGALSRPMTGQLYLTTMRLIFEGKLPASGAKAVAVGAVSAVLLGPLGAAAGSMVKGDDVEFVIPLSTVSRASKHERFGKDLIEVYHSQQGAASPFYFGPAKDIDEVLARLQGLMGSPRSVAPPPSSSPPGYTTSQVPRVQDIPPLPPPSALAVPPIQDPQPLSESPQAPVGRKAYCSNCGNALEEGLKFCTNCGIKVAEKPRVCPSCGAEVTPDMKFCGNCGSRIS
jgi:RNA polymerase subunit RPABC4/transcription elongation factor Spt4